MSIHVEWADARTAGLEIVKVGELTDAFGTTNDKPCLLMGDESVFAIEGSLDDFDEMADRIKQAVRLARG